MPLDNNHACNLYKYGSGWTQNDREWICRLCTVLATNNEETGKPAEFVKTGWLDSPSLPYSSSTKWGNYPSHTLMAHPFLWFTPSNTAQQTPATWYCGWWQRYQCSTEQRTLHTGKNKETHLLSPEETQAKACPPTHWVIPQFAKRTMWCCWQLKRSINRRLCPPTPVIVCRPACTHMLHPSCCLGTAGDLPPKQKQKKKPEPISRH